MALIDLILRLEKGTPLTNQEMDNNLANLLSGIIRSSCDWAGPEPEETFPYMRWIDTTANPAVNKIRNAGNTAWINLGSVTQALGTAAGRSIGSAADQISLNSSLGTAARVNAIGTAPLYGRDSILGAVGQSGGVPTGAVMQSGTALNYYWERLANGLQILTYFATPITDLAPGGSGTATLTFPVAFSNSNYGVSIVFVPNTSTNDTAQRARFGVPGNVKTSTQLRVTATNDLAFALVNVPAAITIVGRWYQP